MSAEINQPKHSGQDVQLISKGPYMTGLETVRQLAPIIYGVSENSPIKGIPSGEVAIGFDVTTLATLFPTAVLVSGPENEKTFTVDMSQLVPAIINSIVALDAVIQRLATIEATLKVTQDRKAANRDRARRQRAKVKEEAAQSDAAMVQTTVANIARSLGLDQIEMDPNLNTDPQPLSQLEIANLQPVPDHADYSSPNPSPNPSPDPSPDPSPEPTVPSQLNATSVDTDPPATPEITPSSAAPQAPPEDPEVAEW